MIPYPRQRCGIMCHPLRFRPEGGSKGGIKPYNVRFADIVPEKPFIGQLFPQGPGPNRFFGARSTFAGCHMEDLAV